MDKAVVMAAGLGSRMQKNGPGVHLSESQSSAADAGLKALIPVGRPFLDYVLTALADAGYRRVCLVIGHHHDAMREYYGQTVDCRRIRIEFALQPEPLGTANAILAAEDFASDDPFLVINSDNYYPVDALGSLRDLRTCGTVAFDRKGLLEGNIPHDRIARYAILDIDGHGDLAGIVEKPDPTWVDTLPDPVGVSMNCWRFDRDVFKACRAISPSERGEYEIADAVQYLIDDLDKKFQTVPISAPVLDLTHRTDIVTVGKRLSHLQVSL